MITNEYTAGLIDGEGCIYLHNERGVPQVRLVMECKATVEAVHAQYGGAIHEVSRNERVRTFHDLCLSGNQAYAMLRAIYPHMITKRAQAKLVLDNWASLQPMKGGAPGKSRLTDHHLAVRSRVYHQLKEMKQPQAAA